MPKFYAPVQPTHRTRTFVIIAAAVMAFGAATGVLVWHFNNEPKTTSLNNAVLPATHDSVTTLATGKVTPATQTVTDSLKRISVDLPGAFTPTFESFDQGKHGVRVVYANDASGHKTWVNFISNAAAAHATTTDLQTLMFAMLGSEAQLDNVSNSTQVAMQSVYQDSGVPTFIRCESHASAPAVANSTGYWCISESGSDVNQTSFEAIANTVEFSK